MICFLYHISRQDLVGLFIHKHESTVWLITLSREMEIDSLLITSFAYAEPPVPVSLPLTGFHSSQHGLEGSTPGWSDGSPSGTGAPIFLQRPQDICMCYGGVNSEILFFFFFSTFLGTLRCLLSKL